MYTMIGFPCIVQNFDPELFKALQSKDQQTSIPGMTWNCDTQTRRLLGAYFALQLVNALKMHLKLKKVYLPASRGSSVLEYFVAVGVNVLLAELTVLG